VHVPQQGRGVLPGARADPTAGRPTPCCTGRCGTSAGSARARRCTCRRRHRRAAGIWISYVPVDEVRRDIRPRPARDHRCVAMSEHPTRR
jgi:hypothetical protein